MTDEPQIEDPPPAPSSSSSIDESTVKVWVKEAVGELIDELDQLDAADPDRVEPISIKDIEAAARKAAEDAMKPLREAKKTAPKAPKAPKPAGDPTSVAPDPPQGQEPSPAEGKKSWLTKLMWGE